MQLPSGLYSQYTEVLDSSPLMKYNLERKVRVEAENQAKEEALNRYFADQLKTYNEAGLRTVHNSGLNKKVKDIQKYWSENSQAIKSGGEARSILDEMFRDASFYVSGAKQRDKTLLEIAKARSEGKLNINKEDMKKVLSNLEKGFDDQSSFKPDGSDWGWMDLSASAPELDAETEAKTYDVLLKNMTPSERDDISRRVTDKVTGEVYTPRIREFTKEQKLAAALSAPSLVIGESDAAKSFRKSYDQILNNPNKTQELEELDRHYKSVFGNDKPFISTPEQVAQAKAIKRLADAYSEKPKEDLNRQQAQQYKINNIIMNRSGKDGVTNLADYDVLGKYQGKVKNFGGVRYIEAKDIDQRDMELIGTRPYNVNGKMGYLVDDNGDWKGANDQFISWAKVAQANLDKTTDSELKRGRLILNPQDAPSKSVKTKATVKPTPKNKNNKTKPPWAN